MLARLKRWFLDTFSLPEDDGTASLFDRRTQQARIQEALANHYRRRNPPPPPEEVAVKIDWTLAPEGFHLWRYDDQKQVAVWMNGKSSIEEYGEVWEVMRAPTFGVSELMQMEMPVLERMRRQAALHEEHLEQALPQVEQAPPASTKPRL